MTSAAQRLHRPAARIVANSLDITSTLIDPRSQRTILVSLTVTDEPGIKSDMLELVIDEREPFGVPPIGSEIEVWLGYEPAPEYMGRYRLDDWTRSGPPNTLKLSAKSADLTTAIKESKVRSWHDTTVGAIVEKVAGEHNLKPVVDQELAGRAIEHIDQNNESDVSFMTRLAGRNGATFKVDDGRLLFVDEASRAFPTGEAKPIAVIRPEDVASWSVTQSERGGHKSVVTQWHDHDAGKRKSVRAGSGKPTHRDRHVYRTEAEARAAADAKLGALTRGKREGQFDGVGNPALFAGNVVRLEGFHPECDGDFFAKTITHTFDAGGYRTSATLETASEDE